MLSGLPADLLAGLLMELAESAVLAQVTLPQSLPRRPAVWPPLGNISISDKRGGESFTTGTHSLASNYHQST